MLSTKIVKIISVVMIAMMLVMTVSNVAMAGGTDLGTVAGDVKPIRDGAQTTDVQTIAGRVIGLLQIIGAVIAVIIIVALGLKYITSSPEGKADYKASAIPLLIGAALLVAGPAIARLIFSVVGNVSNNG